MLQIWVFYFTYAILTTFLEELDKRVLEKQQASKKHVPEQKAREINDHVNSHPLLEAPKWTFDSAWLEGTQISVMLHVLAYFLYYRSSRLPNCLNDSNVTLNLMFAIVFNF